MFTSNDIGNAGIERVIIALSLANQNLLDEQLIDVNVDDFLSPSNRDIFELIKTLHNKNVKIDKTAILASSQKLKLNEEIKADYIQSLIEQGKSPALQSNTEYYVTELKAFSVRRKLISFANDVGEYVEKAESKTAAELVNHTERLLQKRLLSKYAAETAVQIGGNQLDNILYELAHNPTDLSGFKINNFPTLTEILDGIRKQSLLLVGARPGRGKSTLLYNFAKSITIDSKIPLLYIDTEMTNDVVEKRILALQARVDFKSINRGTFVYDEQSVNKIKQAREELRDVPFYHIRVDNTTDLVRLDSICNKYIDLYGIEAICYDFVKLPQANSENRNRQETALIGDLIEGIHGIVNKYNLAAIVAAQLSRASLDALGNDKPITESDFASSDRLIWFSDQIISLRKPTDEEIVNFNNPLRIVEMQKNRHAELYEGIIPLKGNLNHLYFYES